MFRIVPFLFLFIYSSVSSQEDLKLYENIRKYQKLDLTRSVVLSLSSDYYRGRNIVDSSIILSQTYIENILKSQRILALDTSFRFLYNIKDSVFSRNIVGIHYGNRNTNQAILLTANYDHLGVHYAEGEADMIFNGANDNASGVVSLIQIALFFNRIKLKHNVIFAFTSGKRYSMRGSCALANYLENHKFKVRAAFNLEMLGKPISKDNSKLYVKSVDSSDICEKLNKLIGFETFIPYSEDDEFISCPSENIAFNNILKIPSYTITSFNIENDDTYLTPQDDFEHIDVNFLHSSIQKITLSLYKYLQTIPLAER